MAAFALSEAQRAGLADAAKGVEWFISDPVADSIVKRRAFYAALASSLGPYFNAVVPPTLVALHADAARAEAELAAVVAGLQAGRLQLVPTWESQRDIAQGFETARLGVARVGSQLGLWPLAVIGVIGVVAVVAGGAWVLADLYFSAQETAAKADLAKQQTMIQVTDAVRQLNQTNPQAAAALANALQAANQAALQANASTWQQIGQTARDTTPLIALVLLAMWARRRGKL